MDDLEITRLCAEAMGYDMQPQYDPLTNDGQAMALAKRFHLYMDGLLLPDWTVAASIGPFSYEACDPDLNRAICITVANMQKAKHEA